MAERDNFYKLWHDIHIAEKIEEIQIDPALGVDPTN